MPPPRHPLILIDAEKCDGCRRCEMACAMIHTGRCSPAHARIRVLHFEKSARHEPLLCLACEEAPCITCCPMNARRRTPEGAVVTDEERCIGCRACRYICPFAAPTIHPQTGKSMTCDLCADDGAGPWCVTACRDCGALTLVESREALTRKTRERAATAKAGYRPRKKSP